MALHPFEWEMFPDEYIRYILELPKIPAENINERIIPHWTHHPTLDQEIVPIPTGCPMARFCRNRAACPYLHPVMDNDKHNSESTVGQVKNNDYKTPLTIYKKQKNKQIYDNSTHNNNSIYYKAQTQNRRITETSLQGETPTRGVAAEPTLQREAFTRTQKRRFAESSLQGESYSRKTTFQGQTFQRQTRTRAREYENDDINNKRIRRLSEQRQQETIQITRRTEVETHITPTCITNMTSIPGTEADRTEVNTQELSREQWESYNNIKLIHQKQRGGIYNKNLFTSTNTSPPYDNIQQTLQSEIASYNKDIEIRANNKPSLKRTLTPYITQDIISSIEPNSQENKIINLQICNTYEDLTIKRLIRRHERHYTKQKRQIQSNENCENILDYNTKHFTNKLFYNISSKVLTKHEEQILALGLKFTIDNHQMTDEDLLTNIDEYHKTLCKKYDSMNMLKHTTEDATQEIKQLQEYIKHLNIKVKELYRNDKTNIITDSTHNRNNQYHCHNPLDTIAIKQYINTSKRKLNKLLQKYPKSMFRVKQNKTIKTLHNLTKDPTILIKPADKNLGLVIMDTKTYITAGEDKLTKTNNYQRIEWDIPYTSILKEILDILIEGKILIPKNPNVNIKDTMPLDWNQFEETTYTPLVKLLLFYFDHPDMIRICRLYLLPKIHKDPLSWREICSSPGWITFLISIFIDLILQPLLKKVPTYIQDSAAFISNTYNLPMQQEYAFLQADVEALYPSIHIEDGLASLNQTLVGAGIDTTLRVLIVRAT